LKDAAAAFADKDAAPVLAALLQPAVAETATTTTTPSLNRFGLQVGAGAEATVDRNIKDSLKALKFLPHEARRCRLTPGSPQVHPKLTPC